MDNNQLYHHGVKGMRWGVRRYQNEDGTLTAAGKKRQERLEREKPHEDYANAHSKKDVSQMSDAELRARNNRLQMEQQYANLTKKKQNAAVKWVAGILVGAATAVAASYANEYAKKGAKMLETKEGRALMKTKVSDLGKFAKSKAAAVKISSELRKSDVIDRLAKGTKQAAKVGYGIYGR